MWQAPNTWTIFPLLSGTGAESWVGGGMAGTGTDTEILESRQWLNLLGHKAGPRRNLIIDTNSGRGGLMKMKI